MEASQSRSVNKRVLAEILTQQVFLPKRVGISEDFNMGVEAFTVLLIPSQNSTQYQSGVVILNQMAEDMRQYSTSITSDDKAAVPYGTNLCYETPTELFQIKLFLTDHDAVHVSLRFAYCNPQSVDKPFCDIIEWIMTNYTMECYVISNLDPAQDEAEENEKILTVDKVRPILIPAIQYNRRLWQQYAGTDEVAALRPEEMDYWLAGVRKK